MKVGPRRTHSVGLSNRFVIGLLAVATAVLAAPTGAVADYTVSACGKLPNNSWVAKRTAPTTHLSDVEACPVAVRPDPYYGEMNSGMGTTDRLWGGAMPPGGELEGDGQYAELAFEAPAQTTVEEATLDRELGRRFNRWHQYARIDGQDVIGETCSVGHSDVLCSRSGWTSMPVTSAQSLSLGVRCVAVNGCPVGGSLHEVWALILEARITLDDLQPPVVSAVEADGLADGRWHNRSATLTFTASDNTGVQERRIVEGSVVRAVDLAPAAAAGGCRDGSGVAFTYVDPCAGTRGVNGRRSLNVNPCGWGPGSHTIKAVAFDVDRAKTESAPVTVKVDCTSPTVAVDVIDGSSVAGTTLAPALSATDAVSGVASTALEVSVDGGEWQGSSTPVVVEAGRSYRFRARATDVAGNASGWAHSTTVLGVAPIPELEPEAETESEPGDNDPTPRDAERPSAPAASTPLAPVTGPPTIATPVQAPTGGGGAPQTTVVAPTAPSASVAIGKVRTRGRRVTLRGTVARSFSGRVVVALSVSKGKRLIRTARPRNGRWSVRITLPSRRVRPRRASVTTRATSRHAASATHLRLG